MISPVSASYSETTPEEPLDTITVLLDANKTKINSSLYLKEEVKTSNTYVICADNIYRLDFISTNKDQM